MVAFGLPAAKKNHMVALASQPLRKKIVALAAGWDSDMSPYNYFFGEKL